MSANRDDGRTSNAVLEKGKEDDLTLEQAMERARWLADRVRSRRSPTEQPRRLPDETIEDFIASDLLRMNQAKLWGGHELGQAAIVELVSTVAEADGSAGWVFGLLASHFWLACVFGEEVQNEMWGADPTVMMSSSFVARESSIEVVEGGYREWPLAVLQRIAALQLGDGGNDGAAERTRGATAHALGPSSAS